MLDVHVPEHPVHGVRDFFLHLFTITVGLLIALGLEAAVEYQHHRHLAHQAEENIRRELEANGKEVGSVLTAIPLEQKDLQLILRFLQARMENKTVQVRQLQMNMVEANPQDASWKTASATAALNFMNYDRVQRMAAAYQIQEKFAQLQDGAYPDAIGIEAALGLGDPSSMNAADAVETQRHVKMLMAQLEAVREVGVQLQKSYEDALKD